MTLRDVVSDAFRHDAKFAAQKGRGPNGSDAEL
jgi:hypothetical protein